MTVLDEKYNFKRTKTDRASGILMHISSLADPYGIGTIGAKAREFVDFLNKAGQKYWQMLPVGPTGYGDSPYQSFSTYAGNPYFIDLDDLVERGLISKQEIDDLVFVEDNTRVDYGRLYNEKYAVLRKAFERFNREDHRFLSFIEENKSWLRDYVLFMSIKTKLGGIKWNDWPDEYKYRDEAALNAFEEENKEETTFQSFMQFLFYSQWKQLKKYASERGVLIIGDLPIYVAEDSSDLWADPQFFKLNDDLSLKFVGGCPPDDFSDDGQLWGNPIYDWEKMEADGFSWWKNRIKQAFNIFDVVRIDHFRGFESYWSIPAGDKTAKNGEWVPGPAMKLFGAIKEEFGDLPIIAEDLGYMTKEVFQFRMDTGFPGMRILQFAFGPSNDSEHLPHNYDDNSVVYTGTHDNDTILGWQRSISFDEWQIAKSYMNITDEESVNWGMFRTIMTSVAKLSIIQMQDLLFLGNEARMNNPGTLGSNWTWRMKEGSLNDYLAQRLRNLTKISGRLNT